MDIDEAVYGGKGPHWTIVLMKIMSTYLTIFGFMGIFIIFVKY